MHDLIAKLTHSPLCRSKGFKRYGACFVGTEAVAWMLKCSLAPNSEAAVRLGNDLLRMGLLYHVSYKHQFRDKPYLYKCAPRDWHMSASPNHIHAHILPA